MGLNMRNHCPANENEAQKQGYFTDSIVVELMKTFKIYPPERPMGA
jgi:hypothetical protein